MQDQRIADALATLEALQGVRSNQWSALEQQMIEAQVRVSDIQGRMGRLQEEQAGLDGAARHRLDEPLSALQREYAKATAELRIAEAKLGSIRAAMTMAPPAEPLFDRSMIEMTFTGGFFLMLPIAFAIARRIWIRGGPLRQPAVDFESSPRLQRIEEAVESIAIEVERIGEAQRFATKLLTERPESLANRVPIAAPIARKAPGTITPH